MSKLKSNRISDIESLESIEQAINAIRKNPNAPLQVPKDSINKYKGAMHDASRLQMLATWARASLNPVLSFHGSNNVKSVLDELSTYAPGIVAIRLANEVTVGEETVVRRDAIRSATTKMINTDIGNLQNIIHGRTIDLCCVSGVNVQYLKPLFSSRDKAAVRDKAGMHVFLNDLFEIINKRDLNLIPESFIEACSVFSAELFLNTQEHATSNQRGNPYDAHVEGMIVSWDEMEERFFEKDFQGHQRLRDFWSREKVKIRDTLGIRCLQLSFFDTGPGFASRISGKGLEDMSLDEERIFLSKCLDINTTSKQQTGSGGGLPLVLSELQALGGLIRIRSGRLSTFNCFECDQNDPLYNFDDWSDNQCDEVIGAVVSILVPLRRK